MQRIQIGFTDSLTTVSAPDAVLTTEQANRIPKATQQSIETLKNIQTQLDQIESLIQQRFDQLNDSIAAIAIEVTKSVLQSDDDLITAKVNAFVTAAFSTVSRDAITAICVHPDCVKSIADWAVESGLNQVKIEGDSRISMGDCRIETGETGVMASLDSCLSALFQRLCCRGQK